MKRARSNTNSNNNNNNITNNITTNNNNNNSSDHETADEDHSERRRNRRRRRSGSSSQEEEEDEEEQSRRKELRSRYRDLISALLLHQPREAALDAQLLVVTSDLGKERACQLFSEGLSFDPSVFAQHSLSFMGHNLLADEDNDAEDGPTSRSLPHDAWHRLASRAERCFQSTPSFHFMYGLFQAEPPTPKPRVERQKKAPTREDKRIMPTLLNRMDESHQEATEKEVERILGYLRHYHAQNPTEPISYYEFVINPHSFSRTVENIFHTSFLIRDGVARIYLHDKLPCIGPVEDAASQPGESSVGKQCIISISHKSWRELKEAFNITEALILPPNSQRE
ncbi:hypothetical protein CRUP_009632 [Coryphaenoides rupestris]|nr:hypothetical protein CRUP_009632 [Coryphaenoides rupestris]